MNVYDFFKKFKIARHPDSSCRCVWCDCSIYECAQFVGCPLPQGYVFKKKDRDLPKVESHE